MEKPLFNADDYDDSFCMRCETDEEHDAFCEYLDSIERHWRSGHRYTELDYRDHYNGTMVYYFNDGCRSSLCNAEAAGHTILYYKDFSWDFQPENVALTFDQLFCDG